MKVYRIPVIIGYVILLALLIFFAVPLTDRFMQWLAENPANFVPAGIFLAAVLGILQIILCFTCKRIWIRLIPVYPLIPGFLICLYWFFFPSGLGVLLFSMICASMLAIAAIGIAVAWTVFCLYKLILYAVRKTNV